MARVPSISQTAPHMTGHGLRVNIMARVSILRKTELSTMENGKTESTMVWGHSSGRMEVSTKESGGTVRRTDEGSLPVKTGQSTKESGLTADITGGENFKRPTAKFSLEPSKTENFLDD